MFKKPTKNSGFTLIEVIVVSAILALVFGAVFSSFQYSLRLINLSRAKLSAISVANDRMEFFRSLPYGDVGTLLGIPSGTIPQNSTTTLNGIQFTERVLVDYIDDPADGLGTSDSNGIIADYKRVKLEYTWEIGGVPGEITMISNIVPRSIETTAGGGTARINVIDQNSNLLPGAHVRLINASSTGPIDVTRITDSTGAALFSGAPADSNYEVSVTGPIGGKAYSVDKTYVATTSNPNPIRSPFAVLEADISTLTFQIGELSDMNIALKSSITDNMAVEEFYSLVSLASSTDVVSNGSALVLASTTGVYKSYGTAYLRVTPTTIKAWQAVRLAGNAPVGTAYRLYVLTGAGTGPYTLVPDVDLPGNSSGFVDTIIDLSKLDSIVYPELVIGLVLETSNTSLTPIVDEIGVYYREAETPLANKNFTLHGDKIIGTDLSANPIYKSNVNSITDVNGESFIGPMEFDLYHLSMSTSYDVVEGCPAYPFVQKAGEAGNFEFVTGVNNANSLRIAVSDAFGRAVPGAKVQLTRPGYDETRFTGACGQAYFPGAASAQIDFNAIVSATGYISQTINNIDIDGDIVMGVTLDPV